MSALLDAEIEGERLSQEELLGRIPVHELASEPRWLTSIWARAHAAVPVRFDPR